MELREHACARDAVPVHPWVFRLNDPVVYTDKPVVVDGELRSRLEQFKDRDPTKSWAWFVQATTRVTKADFEVLTAAQNRAEKARA